jgi:hypothetical protein
VPSSRPEAIPTVIALVRQLKPRSILDVGVGFGKWGHLFREYTDIVEAENDPTRYAKRNWKVRIEGIEGHTPYLTEMHRYIYDQIHVGDAGSLIKTLGKYDLIFLGDIIEHFEKEAGLSLLRDAIARAHKAVIVSTPKYETGQENLCGNELERHRSLWSAAGFRSLGNAQIKTIGGNILIAIFRPPGSPKLDLNPKRNAKQQQEQFALQRVPEEIRKSIPTEVKFILVDEEQIRSTSRLQNAIPFLERDGQFWGLPEDDRVAIDELERMRQAGARFLAFIRSTFWWLDHYQQFQKHLRSRYSCIREDDQLIVFDLHAS